MFNLFRKKKEVQRPVYVTGCEFACIGKKCPKWVIMYQKVEQEDGTIKTVEDGRCAYAWLPVLLVEKMSELTRVVREVTNGTKNAADSTNPDTRA